MKLPTLSPFSFAPFAALVALLGVSVSTAGATLLTEYTFTASSLEPTTQAPQLKALAAKWGDGLPAPHRGFGSGNASLFLRSSVVNDELSETSTDYIEFTLDAQPGYALNLSSCAFLYGFSHNKETVSHEATFTLRSSIDGYAANIAQFKRISVSGNIDPLPTGRIDLSSNLFKNLSTVTFRIYFSDDGVDSTDYTLRLDTIEIHGDMVTGSIP